MSKKEFEKPKLSKVQELSGALFRVSKELDKKNKELEEKNKQIIKEERARAAMYTNLSHDLRSPIGAIRNSVEYLQSLKEYDMDEVNQVLEVMYGRTNNLEKLVNDIFLLSMLDSNTIKLKCERINLQFFLEEFFYMCDADTKYNNRNLILDLGKNKDIWVNIDTDQFIRVLDNLFTNALKYSEDNSDIILGVKYNKTNIENKNNVIIYVKDTGIGIEQDNIEYIFDRTYTIAMARTPQKVSSYGLGLSIVKGIVQLHGGTIKCNSKVNEYTSFEICMPCS